MGHFGRIEEVPRIEVGERSHRLQILPQAVKIAPIAVQAIDHGKRITVLEHAAAGIQQPQTVGEDVLKRFRGQVLFGVMSQFDVPMLEHGVVGDLLPQGLEAARIDQQPRMLPLDAADQIPGRRDRHAERRR